MRIAGVRHVVRYIIWNANTGITYRPTACKQECKSNIADAEVVYMSENQEKSALTEAAFYILLALHRPMHGYGIMQFAREISNGRVNLGAGTLYGALNALMEKGWIRFVENGWDSRKKEYEITERGRQAVSAELLRLQELLDNGNRIVKEGSV